MSLQTTISNLTKMAESCPNGKKTLWGKEKLLVTSNFSFSHSVFKRLVSQGRQKVSLCGNGLNIFILHRLRNKFLQLILISLDSASWELHQYSLRICGPMKISNLTPAPRNRKSYDCEANSLPQNRRLHKEPYSD